VTALDQPSIAAEHTGSSTRAKLLFSLLILGIAGMLTVIAIGFPIDMDELLPYHPLACQAAAQQVNTFTSACNSHPITFGPFEYQQAFDYIGATSTWLMAPLFALANWTGWHLVVGVAVLVLAMLGVLRSLKLSLRWWPAAIAFFPIAFETIHDTGPIRISLITLCWTPVLVRSVLKSRSRTVQVLAILGLLLAWLASAENKPYFLYVAPGIVIWTLAVLAITEGWDFVKQKLGWLIAIFGLLGLGCLALLITMRVGDQSYLSFLMETHGGNDLAHQLGTGTTFILDWPFSAQRMMALYPNVDGGFFAPLQSPLNALPMTADRGAPLSLLLLVLTCIAVLLLYIWSIRVLARTGQARQALYVLLAALVLFVGAVLSGGGSVHHFVFAQVPLLALVLLAFSRFPSRVVLTTAVMLATSLLALAAAYTVPLKNEVSRDIDTVTTQAIADAGKRGLVNCQDWGCYFQYSLKNLNEVPVVWAEKPDQQAQLARYAVQHDLNIEQVCLKCDLDSVTANYPGAGVAEVLSTPSGWKLFSITP